MRVTIGMFGVLGLGLSVSVALAQGPAPGSGQRGAVLLPPQKFDPTDTPAVARGAADDLSPYPGSTPVTRPTAGASGSPAWINGTSSDPNIRQAGGVPTGQYGRGVTQVSGTSTTDPSLMSKGMDKLKGTFVSDKANPAADPRNQANANTAFRGTAANGAPVYAGPPAYRWYGWGSVTPGANPYAPTGIAPIASANWYAITGATPGAFPVPVMNPLRPAPGTEPPTYISRPAPRMPPVTYAAPGVPVSVAAPQPPAYPQPESSRAQQPSAESQVPPPTISPLPIPTATAPLSPTPEPPKSIAAVAVPTLAMPPAPVAPPIMPQTEAVITKETATDPAAPRVTGNPLVLAPMLPSTPVTSAEPMPPLPALPAVPPITGAPVVRSAPVATQDPAPLPVSVTEEPKWQPGNTRPTTNEWNPAGQKPQGQPQSQSDPNWEHSRGNTSTQPVARGQIGDNRPDPVVTLIRKVCETRAVGVEVRWVGSKKLTVCFECRNATDAQNLVKDISARPELSPFQIDFCVFVK